MKTLCILHLHKWTKKTTLAWFRIEETGPNFFWNFWSLSKWTATFGFFVSDWVNVFEASRSFLRERGRFSTIAKFLYIKIFLKNAFCSLPLSEKIYRLNSTLIDHIFQNNRISLYFSTTFSALCPALFNEDKLLML